MTMFIPVTVFEMKFELPPFAAFLLLKRVAQSFEPQKLCGLSLFRINSIWMFTMLRAAEFERHKLCAPLRSCDGLMVPPIWHPKSAIVAAIVAPVQIGR